MIEADPIVQPTAALAEVKSFLRVEGAREDGLLQDVLATATDLCEQFTGEVLLERMFRERLPASAAWQRLGRRPVRAITSVQPVDGESTGIFPGSAYSVDIDAAGAGWVRLNAPGGTRHVLVTYSCGIAVSWEAIPEALRHGIIRLAAHLYTHRSGAEDPGRPAAVTALWRPYRRLRLG